MNVSVAISLNLGSPENGATAMVIHVLLPISGRTVKYEGFAHPKHRTATVTIDTITIGGHNPSRKIAHNCLRSVVIIISLLTTELSGVASVSPRPS